MVCECGEEEEGDGSSEIMMSKNYWGRKRRYAALQPDTKLILRQGGLYLFLFTVNLRWNKKLCGREVGELSLLGLIYEKKKKKKKSQRADRVQWPSFFLQAGTPCEWLPHWAQHSQWLQSWEGRLLGRWPDGGRLHGAAILCLPLSPTLAHTASPLISLSLPPRRLSIHLFIQPILPLFALTLSQRCPPFHSRIL